MSNKVTSKQYAYKEVDLYQNIFKQYAVDVLDFSISLVLLKIVTHTQVSKI